MATLIFIFNIWVNPMQIVMLEEHRIDWDTLACDIRLTRNEGYYAETVAGHTCADVAKAINEATRKENQNGE